MQTLAVFRAERDAGLEQVIRSNTGVAMASVAHVGERTNLSKQTVDRLRGLSVQFTKGDINDFDLHHLTSVMVTVGWNKNDDVFDPVETWAARKTPEDKPLNCEHDDSNIIGHITANYVMGADGKPVTDDTLVGDLPPQFHIVTSAVLYKNWQTKERQKRMDDIIAEIAKGEWILCRCRHKFHNAESRIMPRRLQILRFFRRREVMLFGIRPAQIVVSIARRTYLCSFAHNQQEQPDETTVIERNTGHHRRQSRCDE